MRSANFFWQRLLPQPALSAVLVALWLMLANTVTVVQCLLAAALAWLLPLLLQKLSEHKLLRRTFLWQLPHIDKPWLLLRFALLVCVDIVVANFEVAMRILQSNHRLRPAFIEMPLSLRNESVIALLMSVITLTPGTLAAQLSDDRSSLLIHTLHTDDAAALVEQLKQRYEQPLLEIFN
jgi:multicomponent K+:H+ antiporter subunit E